MTEIITNNHWREVTYLPISPDIEDSDDVVGCVTYKRNRYTLAEFMPTHNLPYPYNTWDGYHPDTYFSGILIKLDRNNDTAKMGRYFT